MRLRTYLSRLRHWFRRETPAPRLRPTVRPRLEQLEAREVPSVVPNDAFLAAVYQGFLGRAVDIDSLAFFRPQLNAGVSRTDIAAQIIASPEFQGRELQLLYLQLLGRPLDTPGLQLYGPLLRGTGDVDQVKAAILGSQEFFVRNGSTIQGFLNGVYTSQLGRPLDQQGLVFWTTQLVNGGLSREQVAAQVLNSAEAGIVKTGAVYQEILGRGLDGLGASFWGQVLQSGQPQEAVLAGVAGSDEFFAQLSTFNTSTFLLDFNQVANQFFIDANRFNTVLPGIEILNRTLPTNRFINSLSTVVALAQPVVLTTATLPSTVTPFLSPVVTGISGSLFPTTSLSTGSFLGSTGMSFLSPGSIGLTTGTGSFFV